MSSIN
jgi:hypothetical protein